MAWGYGTPQPKPIPRVLTKHAKKRAEAKAERECRKEVRKRHGTKCAIPGCREPGVNLHHVVFRSKARTRKADPNNLVPVCLGHHQLIHRHLIALHWADDGELIVTGPKDVLKFKL